MPIKLLAQAEEPLGTIGSNGKDLGPFGNIAAFVGQNIGDAGLALGRALSAIIDLMIVVGGLWFLFQLVIGALQWIGSGGDKNGLQQAQQKITNGFVGLIIVVAALVITQLLSTFFGFNILNPASFLGAVQFK